MHTQVMALLADTAPVGAATWVIAASTAIYAIVTVFMWLAIRRQARIAGTSAKAAVENADAARRSAEGLRTTQRAWLFGSIERHVPIHPAAGTVIHGGSAYVPVTVKVVNYGNTPAWITRTETAQTLLRAGEALPPEPRYELSGPDKADVFMPPRDSIPLQFMIPATYASDLNSGRVKLYIYGRVVYRSVFADSALFETAFCFEYHPPGVSGPQWTFYPGGPPKYNYER